jgi:hypothetical protein
MACHAVQKVSLQENGQFICGASPAILVRGGTNNRGSRTINNNLRQVWLLLG